MLLSLILRFFYIIITLIIIVYVKSVKQFDVGHYLDPFDSHPRLLMKNGHLVLLTGRNKDIVFRSSGSGQIRINGNDLLATKLQSINQELDPINSNTNDIVAQQNSSFDLHVLMNLHNV
nr:uncharacterized protein LOC124491102 [Dermatophagoides farinae]